MTNILTCPNCGSTDIRTYSNFNTKTDRWDWMNGCNHCPWEARNIHEESLHPHYYSRMKNSPGKISSKNIRKTRMRA